MRKITFFLFGVLLWTALICGQNIPAGFVKSFTTIAPDTVVQGEPFNVCYTLVSKTWDIGAHPLSGGGFMKSDTYYDTKSDGSYSTLATRVTYTCIDTGRVELPGMVASVRKKKITTTKSIYVKTNPVYGAEMSLAVNHLRGVGQHEDSVCLKMAREEKHFLLFDDLRNKNFCIVAKKELWSLLKQPVLAYSTESDMSCERSVDNYHWIEGAYTAQIDALLAGDAAGNGDRLKYTARNTEIPPMLGELRWNQRAPYNNNAPTMNGKKLLVGCVPLSMAMVMNYHKWPEQGQSKCHYLNGGNIYTMDFSVIRPQWNIYRDYYQKGGSATIPDDLTKMLLFLGLSIDASFSENSTTAYYRNVKPVLCNNLGYSGKMQYHYNLTDNDIVSLIYRELDNKRPCILSSRSHAFVCDGRSGDFVHYNMGWGGWRNGYYQLKIGDYAKQEKMLVMPKGIVCGIEPQRNEYAKEVTLKKAGTLESMFTEEEKECVTKLKISGPLNGTDIRFIRKMAGAIDTCLFSEWTGGTLRSLDLSAANIVNSNDPYIVTPAYGRWTTNPSYMEFEDGRKVYYGKSKVFDFSNMTEREWKEFKRTIGTNKDGRFYTRTDDNRYWSNYVCQKGVIGRYMFKGCTSLHTLILPEKTKEIQDDAFHGCSSIVTMRIPQKTDVIGNKMFTWCISLVKVELPKSISNYREQSEFASPCITIERY